MLAGINLEIAMTPTNDSHPMIELLIIRLAIVVTVAIDFFGFCYE
jgi:hypothetical protein